MDIPVGVYGARVVVTRLEQGMFRGALGELVAMRLRYYGAEFMDSLRINQPECFSRIDRPEMAAEEFRVKFVVISGDVWDKLSSERSRWQILESSRAGRMMVATYFMLRRIGSGWSTLSKIIWRR